MKLRTILGLGLIGTGLAYISACILSIQPTYDWGFSQTGEHLIAPDWNTAVARGAENGYTLWSQTKPLYDMTLIGLIIALGMVFIFAGILVWQWRKP